MEDLSGSEAESAPEARTAAGKAGEPPKGDGDEDLDMVPEYKVINGKLTTVKRKASAFDKKKLGEKLDILD